MVKNQERIAELKKRLAKYSNKDQHDAHVKAKIRDEREQIKDLKKQIKAKKYAKLKQTGKNLKIIGKNIGIITNQIGKGMSKFCGNNPKNPKIKAKRKSLDEVMASLPQ